MVYALSKKEKKKRKEKKKGVGGGWGERFAAAELGSCTANGVLFISPHFFFVPFFSVFLLTIKKKKDFFIIIFSHTFGLLGKSVVLNTGLFYFVYLLFFLEDLSVCWV